MGTKARGLLYGLAAVAGISFCIGLVVFVDRVITWIIYYRQIVDPVGFSIGMMIVGLFIYVWVQSLLHAQKHQTTPPPTQQITP